MASYSSAKKNDLIFVNTKLIDIIKSLSMTVKAFAKKYGLCYQMLESLIKYMRMPNGQEHRNDIFKVFFNIDHDLVYEDVFPESFNDMRELNGTAYKCKGDCIFNRCEAVNIDEYEEFNIDHNSYSEIKSIENSIDTETLLGMASLLLSPVDFSILVYYFGVGIPSYMTENIGDIHNRSMESTRQIKNHAVKKLHKSSLIRAAFDFNNKPSFDQRCKKPSSYYRSLVKDIEGYLESISKKPLKKVKKPKRHYFIKVNGQRISLPVIERNTMEKLGYLYRIKMNDGVISIMRRRVTILKIKKNGICYSKVYRFDADHVPRSILFEAYRLMQEYLENRNMQYNFLFYAKPVKEDANAYSYY